MWSIAFALIPKRYLIGTGLVLAALAAIFVSVAAYGHHRASSAYTAGYTRARDSVWVAETQHRQVLLDSMEAAADSIHNATVITQARLDSAASHFKEVTERRHIAVDTVPSDTSLARVTSMATGKHWLIPRDAALEWAGTDSLLSVATALLAKYAAANQQWASAYAAEHNARLGADSLSALWRTRALSAQPSASHGMSWQGKVLHAAAWAAVVLVVRNNVHKL